MKSTEFQINTKIRVNTYNLTIIVSKESYPVKLYQSVRFRDLFRCLPKKKSGFVCITKVYSKILNVLIFERKKLSGKTFLRYLKILIKIFLVHFLGHYNLFFSIIHKVLDVISFSNKNSLLITPSKIRPFLDNLSKDCRSELV